METEHRVITISMNIGKFKKLLNFQHPGEHCVQTCARARKTNILIQKTGNSMSLRSAIKKCKESYERENSV